MALSPNYNWSEPDNSSLVKDGALAMRTLGDAIDTSVWNVGFGQAAKNKILNSDFGIWQRGTSFSNPGTNAYVADRFKIQHDGTGATRTISRQSFTPGTAPVAGYESSFFLRYNVSAAGSGNSYNILAQPIEDVRTFANQPITVSFWAKSDTARTVYVDVVQDFGSGGSSAIATGAAASQNTSTSWQRFSFNITLPTISGKTIGTSSNILVRIWTSGNTTFTTDIWGFQVEYGSKMTPFQTATGTIQGELAACQRYYQRFDAAATNEPLSANGGSLTTTISQVEVVFPVFMRSAPSSLDVSNFEILNYANNTAYNTGSLTINLSTKSAMQLRYTHGTAVFTAGSVVHFRSGSGTGYLGWSAEL